MYRYIIPAALFIAAVVLYACLSETSDDSPVAPPSAKGMSGGLKSSIEDGVKYAHIDGVKITWSKVDSLCGNPKVCCYDCDGNGVEGCNYRTSWYYLPVEEVKHVDDIEAQKWYCMPTHKHKRVHGGEIKAYFPDGNVSCVDHKHLWGHRRSHFTFHPTEDCP